MIHTPPEILDFPDWELARPEIFTLDNGIPVYAVNMGTQDILKVELLVKAGRPFESKKLAARATARLLREGSLKHSGAALAEQIDYYGGSLSSPFNLDTSNLSMYCLTKNFSHLAPIFAQIIGEPTFPEEELHSFIANQKHRLKVDLTKNDVIAYRNLTEFIFGSAHPYGYNSMPEMYDQLKRKDLITHYQQSYRTGNSMLFVSGKFNAETLQTLNRYIGQTLPTGIHHPGDFTIDDLEPKSVHFYNPNTVQTAIRIGCRLFTREHPDYFPLYILNTIFGGYFGSRLMANIREEKGYTYNIYSALDPMLFDGSFCIATEVGNEFVEQTLEEIYYEMDLLCKEPVEEEELSMVRNYLLGNMLSMVDGPFNTIGQIKAFTLDGLPLDSFQKIIHLIRTITPEKLMELANTYFRKEKMWQITVGSKPVGN